MKLSFKPQFKDKILSGDKIHTIRNDRNKRWTIGKKIHFVTGLRTKNQNQFKEGECLGLQKIVISSFHDAIFISDREMSDNEKWILARNDGFDCMADFYDWFNEDFFGIIIHWTDYLYSP